MEELEHHFPLKLLMELSDAAAQAVQASAVPLYGNMKPNRFVVKAYMDHTALQCT